MFETVAFRQNELEFWDEHMARLRSAAEYFGLGDLPRSSTLQTAALGLLKGQPLHRSFRVRVAVSRMTSGNEITIGVAPLQTTYATQWTLVLSDVIRPAGNPTTRYKTLAYTDNLAAQRGLAAGQEALLLNQWGRVACSAFANVYAYVDGVWVTPSVSEGALPGIVRGRLLAGADGVLGVENLQGERVIEGRLAIEVFVDSPMLMSNSVRGVAACQMALRSTGWS